MTLLEAACIYARSYKVFPLAPQSKSKQLLRSWKNEASNDLAQVERWWKACPQANIGLVTGNGLLVIDVDNKNGKNGSETLKPYLDDFPDTMIVKTPSGGYHYYFEVEGSFPNKVNLYEGIDIRSDGGYILAPPSVIDHQAYMNMNNYTIAKANDAVYAFLKGPSKEVNTTSSIIHEGERNNQLFKLGCRLHANGISNDIIKICLEAENNLRCQPPLALGEVERIYQSIIHRYDKGKSEDVEEINVMDLIDGDFDEQEDIVEDMLTPGVCVLGAPQKIGKTFFCLQLAIAISKGESFMGRHVQKKRVLYIALEDSKSKLNKRIKTFGVTLNRNLDFRFEKAYNPDFDLEEVIDAKKQEDSNLGVVVIDTFAKIKKNKKVEYDMEYEEVSRIHELGIKYNVCIILVTHVKKEIDRDNPFDSIYGSRGVTAAADSMMVMFKRGITKVKELHITGKDIPDERQLLIQDEHLLYHVVEEEVEENVNENLIRVINYIIRAKVFTGSHLDLSAKLNLPLTGKALQCLLKNNKDLLESNFIVYEVGNRTSRARQMKLSYLGDDEMNCDDVTVGTSYGSSVI